MPDLRARLTVTVALAAALSPAGLAAQQQRPPHWSYQRVERPALPAVRDAAWCQEALDGFVLARLEREGLQPSPPADRAAWLRRASLDLCGLPPSPADVDAFVADSSPDAFGKQVDRLLAQPAYGECRAQRWLDLARYADSQGYEKDDLRPYAWRWRDWVIDAFARDLPFDRFTIEQLAGDLLPDPSLEQLVATAFHRQTMTNTEGGTDDEEFRTDAVIDRTNTTLSVWMGSTVGCAQCHDHKFDPISQREYYQLFAFFDQTQDDDQPDERPTLNAPTPSQQQRQREVGRELAGLRERLRGDGAVVAAWSAAQRTRLLGYAAARLQQSTWHFLGPVPGKSFDDACDRAFAPEHGVLLDAAQEGLRWQERPDFVDGKVHNWRGDNSAFYLQRTIHAETAATATLALGRDDAIKVFCNGVLVLAHKSPGAAAPEQDFAEVELHEGDNEILLKVVNGGGPGGFWYELRSSRLGAPAEAALAATDACSPAQQGAIVEAYGRLAPELAATREAIAAHERELAELQGPAVPVLRELPAEQRRTTRIHLRGSFLTQGDAVTPDVPACWPPLPADAPRNRLGLARWLVLRDNPLTARVQCNRCWEELFGRGLVPTSEDFGKQGEVPQQRELLDWLAAEFMDNGWSVKKLLREIVLSATYRQSSVVSAALRERDPYNDLLARGPSFRLAGETLRDQALAVSGLLSAKIGGPSVMPAQPDGIWGQIYSGARWTVSPGEDRHRRSLYTFWRRTSPHPMLTTFDAPSREYCVVRRVRTNTPLQALVTWNDPEFVECAQALAARVLRECADGDDAARLLRMVRLALLRAPTAAEQERLLAFVRGERDRLRGDGAAAAKIAGGGDADAATAGERAAWTLCANVILNLDEFVTKG